MYQQTPKSQFSAKLPFALVEGKKTRALTSESIQMHMEGLTGTGAILFRGFDVDVDEFSKFVERNSRRVAIDPARAFFAKNVQLVDAGTEAVGLHCENANTPMLPDIVWFYCQKAAARGSETTLCDGYEAWNGLSAETRALFLRHRVTYARTVPEDLWTKYVRTEFGLDSGIPLTQDSLSSMFAKVEGVKVHLESDRALNLEVTVPMAHVTRFGTRLAFANSLLGPSYNYQKPRISFDDGSAIPERVMAEIRSVTNHLTRNIPWQDGDVIAIDNTRVMHGRREILDGNRRLFTALSYV